MSDDAEMRALADVWATAMSPDERVTLLLGMLQEVSAERDRLRAVVDAARGVRRLREASRTVEEPADWDDEDEVERMSRRLAVATIATSDALDVMSDRLDQLDVSPAIGGMTPEEAYEFYADPANQEPQGSPVRRRIVADVDPTSPTYDPDQYGTFTPITPSVGDRATCRWCHQPITFTSSSKLTVAEDSWAHDGPQPGSGRVRQRQCEPDMQSMLAEPTAQTDESDDLRQLVHDLWAHWNDDTMALYHALAETDGGEPVGDMPTLDFTPDQRALLDRTIRWAHGQRDG